MCVGPHLRDTDGHPRGFHAEVTYAWEMKKHVATFGHAGLSGLKLGRPGHTELLMVFGNDPFMGQVPQWCPCQPFFGGEFPTKIDYRRKGTLILPSKTGGPSGAFGLACKSFEHQKHKSRGPREWHATCSQFIILADSYGSWLLYHRFPWYHQR